MNYSLTYIGIIIAVIGRLGQFLGVPTDSVTVENLQTLIPAVLQVIGVITALYGRYRKGGITPLGFKAVPNGTQFPPQ